MCIPYSVSDLPVGLANAAKAIADGHCVAPGAKLSGHLLS